MELVATDVEQLAVSAYMLGRLEEYVDTMARAHQLHLDDRATQRAARCAFWTGIPLLVAGAMGRGSGWISRAQRLVDEEANGCVEQGYLRLPVAFRCEMQGDYDGAAATAGDATEIARRFADQDLFALAVHVHGHALVRAGRVADGLALLDEAMVAVTTGEVSPIATWRTSSGAPASART